MWKILVGVLTVVALAHRSDAVSSTTEVPLPDGYIGCERQQGEEACLAIPSCRFFGEFCYEACNLYSSDQCSVDVSFCLYDSLNDQCLDAEEAYDPSRDCSVIDPSSGLCNGRCEVITNGNDEPACQERTCDLSTQGIDCQALGCVFLSESNNGFIQELCIESDPSKVECTASLSAGKCGLLSTYGCVYDQNLAECRNSGDALPCDRYLKLYCPADECVTYTGNDNCYYKTDPVPCEDFDIGNCPTSDCMIYSGYVNTSAIPYNREFCMNQGESPPCRLLSTREECRLSQSCAYKLTTFGSDIPITCQECDPQVPGDCVDDADPPPCQNLAGVACVLQTGCDLDDNQICTLCPPGVNTTRCLGSLDLDCELNNDIQGCDSPCNWNFADNTCHDPTCDDIDNLDYCSSQYGCEAHRYEDEFITKEFCTPQGEKPPCEDLSGERICSIFGADYCTYSASTGECYEQGNVPCSLLLAEECEELGCNFVAEAGANGRCVESGTTVPCDSFNTLPTCVSQGNCKFDLASSTCQDPGNPTTCFNVPNLRCQISDQCLWDPIEQGSGSGEETTSAPIESTATGGETSDLQLPCRPCPEGTDCAVPAAECSSLSRADCNTWNCAFNRTISACTQKPCSRIPDNGCDSIPGCRFEGFISACVNDDDVLACEDISSASSCNANPECEYYDFVRECHAPNYQFPCSVFPAFDTCVAAGCQHDEYLNRCDVNGTLYRCSDYSGSSDGCLAGLHVNETVSCEYDFGAFVCKENGTLLDCGSYFGRSNCRTASHCAFYDSACIPVEEVPTTTQATTTTRFINRCELFPAPCHDKSACRVGDVSGNYTCDPCPDGYDGSPYMSLGGCQLISCPISGFVSANARISTSFCTNVRKDDTCDVECMQGFSDLGGNVTKKTFVCGADRQWIGEITCQDVNECSVRPCDEKAVCRQTSFGDRFQCTCPAGYRGDGIGDGGCVNINECDQGVCQDTQCTDLDGSYQCALCAGGYRQLGNGRCSECSTGRFQDEEGQTECKQCPVGKFQDEEQMSECKLCADGDYQNEEGEASCKAQTCPRLLSPDPEANANVKSCPSIFPGDSCEVTCSAGYKGATTNYLCTSGRADVNDASWVGFPDCQAVDCPSQTTPTPTSGIIQTAPCNPTSFGSVCAADKFTCGPGSVGQVSPEYQHTCTASAEWQEIASLGETGCAQCEVGKFQDEASQATCKNCGNGQYQNEVGKSICKSHTTCPGGSFQTKAPTSSTDRECLQVTPCNSEGDAASQYIIADPSATSNYVCGSLTSCGIFDYQKTAPTPYSDRVCERCRDCLPETAGGVHLEWQQAECTDDRDTVCSPVTLACPPGQLELELPNARRDRLCGSFPNVDSPQSGFVHVLTTLEITNLGQSNVGDANGWNTKFLAAVTESVRNVAQASSSQTKVGIRKITPTQQTRRRRQRQRRAVDGALAEVFISTPGTEDTARAIAKRLVDANLSQKITEFGTEVGLANAENLDATLDPTKTSSPGNDLGEITTTQATDTTGGTGNGDGTGTGTTNAPGSRDGEGSADGSAGEESSDSSLTFIIIGAAAGLVVLALLIAFILYRRRKKSGADISSSTPMKSTSDSKSNLYQNVTDIVQVKPGATVGAHGKGNTRQASFYSSLGQESAV